MLDTQVLDTPYDLAEMSDLQRPNLLDNADFKSGIINQRGEDSYTGSTSKNVYTIDRWSINTNTANTLSIENGYITCTLADNGLLTQYIDSELSGAITFAIKLKDEDLKVVSVSEYSSENEWESLIYDFGELETGLNVKVVKDVSTTNKWRLRFQNVSVSNKTLNIEYIKLEKGSVYTGIPEWDYEMELLKCMRKFQIQEIAETIWSDVTGQISTRSVNYFVPMDNTPSISYEVYDEYNVENVSAGQPTKSRYTISYVLLNDIGTGHRYGIRVFIDAETY